MGARPARADQQCMDRCPRCRARTYDGAGWCGLCGWRPASEEEAAALLEEATSPGARAAVLPKWRAGERHVAPPPEQEHSRWKRGPLSLGPVGKIVVTAIATWVPVWLFLYANSPGSGLIVAAMLPLLYRDIWRKRRIR